MRRSDNEVEVLSHIDARQVLGSRMRLLGVSVLVLASIVVVAFGLRYLVFTLHVLGGPSNNLEEVIRQLNSGALKGGDRFAEPKGWVAVSFDIDADNACATAVGWDEIKTVQLYFKNGKLFAGSIADRHRGHHFRWVFCDRELMNEFIEVSVKHSKLKP